jgi:hypothetical protein
VELRDRMICWSWQRGGVEPEEVIGSGRYWTLRLPLSTERASWGYINLYRGFESGALLLDINYLCQPFQREMARAAERVLSEKERALPDEAPLAVGAAGGN